VIVSVLFLIGLFLCISCYLILTGLNFIGLSYLLVYIGAVVISMNKFAALVRIQLYKVLLDKWYNYVLSYINKKYRDFSSLTLKKKLIKTKTIPGTVGLIWLQGRTMGNYRHLGNIGNNRHIGTKPILWASCYSTMTYKDSLNNTEFYEWLCGFVDGEGYFRIKKDSRRDRFPYVFEFTILLHLFYYFLIIFCPKRRINYFFIKKKSIHFYTKINTSLKVHSSPFKYVGSSPRLGIQAKVNYSLLNRMKTKQMNSGICYYSTNNNLIVNVEAEFKKDESKLNPHWVSGFVDAEGSFMVRVYKQAGKTGWGVTPSFSIHLHKIDIDILYALQNYFGVGNVYLNKNGKSASYIVSNLKDINNVIIPHFKNYPLQSCKCIDLQLWSLCIEIVVNKEHLTIKGLNKIVELKSILNKGLSEILRVNFPGINLIERPIFQVNKGPLNPYWVSGFTEGDGSFYVTIFFFQKKIETNYVRMFYSIALNNRETPLIRKIQEYFKGIGSIVESIDNNYNTVKYKVVSIKDLNEFIIPQFDTYKFFGNKHLNYLIWKEILLLVNSKAHLTAEGLKKIRSLQSKLNKWEI